MLKKVITYKDFEGNEVKEEFCFHMMEADFIDLDFKYEEFGGLRGYLMKLIKDIQEAGEAAPKKPMYDFLKELIYVSVGKKVDKRFDRSEAVKNDFFQTGAYSGFIMGMLAEPNGIPNFVDAITPEVDPSKRKAAIEELRKEGINIPEMM